MIAYLHINHNSALLLMDGSVWTAGQDKKSFCGQEEIPAHGKKVEIYRPDYYFDTDRPTITDWPNVEVGEEEVFDVEYTVGDGRSMNPSEGARVALIRFSSVTHSVNFSQRYLILEFSLDLFDPDEKLNVTAPANEYAPPGPYMLVLIDDTGIPSVAKVVYLE
jgi:hypothetical protein